VIGVGGGGSNAVNHMYLQGIVGVNFVVCNTDAQALDMSPVPNKIQLGPESTGGLGAGSNPEVGRISCEESEEEIRDILSKNTKMVFITAGMGGGTGTGAAPVVAKIARELGILTVGIVTTPFSYEGSRKINQAEEGIKRMKESVDTVLVISNDKLREMYSALKRSEAFAIANNILATAAKSISEIITVPGEINVDFADVAHVMKNSGVAIMGVGLAEGEDRALRAVQSALNSPLLNDNDISGAKKLLVNISTGEEEMSIDEIDTIIEYAREAAGADADVIFGAVDDPNLGSKISVTIIATGFEPVGGLYKADMSNRKVHVLEQPVATQTTLLNLNEFEVEKVEDTPLVFDNIPADEMKHDLPVDFTQHEVSDNEMLKFELHIKEPVEEVKPVEMPSPVYNKVEDVQPVKETESLPFDGMFSVPMSQVNDVVKNEVNDSVVNNSFNNKQNMEMNAGEQSLSERKNRMRNLSFKFQNPQNLQELENEPAYLRRNVELEKMQHSSESNVSPYTLNNININGDIRPEIRKNNPFLHDTVD
jgi:cell division protein FtsZ